MLITLKAELNADDMQAEVRKTRLCFEDEETTTTSCMRVRAAR